MLEWAGLALHPDPMKMDGEDAPRVVDVVKPVLDCHHRERQFLVQLAAGRLGHGLPVVDLAPGKLPEASVPLVRGTSSHEEAAVSFDDGRHDRDGVH